MKLASKLTDVSQLDCLSAPLIDKCLLSSGKDQTDVHRAGIHDVLTNRHECIFKASDFDILPKVVWTSFPPSVINHIMTHPLVRKLILRDSSEGSNRMTDTIFVKVTNWFVCLMQITYPNTLNSNSTLTVISRCLWISSHCNTTGRMNLQLCVFLCLFLFFSGPSWLAEVALQHQPLAAEPPSADESGRWRGRQGQRA